MKASRRPAQFIRFSLRQAAAELGMKVPTMRRLVVKGPVEAVQINGRFYLELPELKRLKQQARAA